MALRPTLPKSGAGRRTCRRHAARAANARLESIRWLEHPACVLRRRIGGRMKTILTFVLLSLALAPAATAQEARRRWEMQRQIRLDKFEQVLPQAMRGQGIDMWIVMAKENHYDPLWEDLGRGYISGL